MSEPTGNVVSSSIQGDYVSEINSNPMLSPFLVWASKSGIAVRETSSKEWEASSLSGSLCHAHTREQAADRVAQANGLERYDEWRLRLSMARASWHYPLWKVVSSLPGGKTFVGFAVGVTKDEVRHFLDSDGFKHEGAIEVNEVLPDSITRETEPFGNYGKSVFTALRHGSCGMVLSLVAS